MRTLFLTGARLRRWTLALAGTLGAGVAAQAQTLNYATAKAANVAGTFTSIASTGTTITTASTDDANSAATNIGFTFNFNGTAFTQFVLNTNGFIKLGSTAPSSASLFFTPETTIAGDVFSSTNAADVNIIAPFNCDLESGATPASYQVQTSGSLGSRVCTIQWTGVRDKAMTNSPQYTNFSFQVKLYEGTNRVELVYGLPTAGTGADALRYSGAGIKGSGAASGQVLTFTKTSASAWSTATVQGAIYTTNTLNYRQTVLPDAGRTFRFDPQVANDAAVASIFTLGKLPVPAAQPHAVQASISNLGTATLTNVPVTLTVTGANSFTDTKTVASLAAGATATVTFTNYPSTLNTGTNTVTVTVPSDDNNSNNTGTYGQLVTSNRLTYIDQTGTFNATGVGVGQAGGALVAKYSLAAASALSDVVLTFAASTGNTSTYQVVVYDATGTGGTPGAVLYTSPTQTRTAAAGNATVTIPGVAVPANFYIGIKELATNPALAYQVEDPLKPNTYYYSLDGTTGWTSVNTTTLRTRLAIEAGLTTPAACQAPTNLAVSGLTPTGATLTFTAPSGASSYTVTYTPAGGTATTVTPAPTSSPVTLTGLTAGTTYSVSVTASCGAGQTSVASTTTFSTPLANDECSGAVVLTPSSTCTPTNGTTVGASQSLAAITCNNYTGTADDDVWYRFTATTTSATVTVVGGANLDAVVDVRSGTCANSTNIGCADATVSGGTEAVALNGLTVGSTYYVRVYGYGSGASTADAFTICVTTGAPATLANDDPSGAIALTPSSTCTPTNGTNVGATTTTANGYTNPGTCGVAINPKDVWYTFTTLAGQTAATVTVTGAPAGLVRVFSASSAAGPFTEVNCSAGSTNNTVAPPLLLNGLTPNTTYYIAVSGYGSGDTQGTFTICVTTPSGAACAAVTNAAVTTAPGTATASTGEVTFTPAAGATNYYLTLATGGNIIATGNFTASPVQLTGLTPGTSYTVTITTNCSNGGVSSTVSVTFTAAAAPPVPTNDDPSGATTLTVSSTCTPTNGTNAGATTTTASGYANPGTCGIAVNPKDVWYKFTTLAGQTAATVTVTGAPAGLVRVFSASSAAGPFTQVSCSAGSTNNTVAPPLALTGLTPNTTYYISVAGYGSADTQGAFTICVTGTGTVTCPAVTSLAAGSITATGATLTFTAASGATNYTVTYTPTGGTAQTVTTTTSPVVLTGLTPGTTYSVSVVTNCSASSTSTGATTTFTTLATPTCPTVTGLTAGSITATGATLTFTAPSGASNYTITYSPTGSTGQTITATASPVTLAGLTPGTNYTVTVATNCSNGATSTVASTAFITLSPAPTNVAVGSITATSASIAFTPVSGATSYTVTYTAAGGQPRTVTVSGSPANLTSLTANTAYTVTVVANYPAGSSSPVTITFTTQTLAVRTTLGGGELTVFPNPAHHAFTLSVPAVGARAAQLELVNALGQVVRRQQLSLMAGGSQVAVDATGLATGLYWVRVQAGSETAVIRISLQ